ncbi:hypothetical protein [Bacillus dakarensis]|uniref:hypothetical protein n=1 Tax=Robertmurraya dakarensis TaxID=1926278 RepID=UPI00098131AB|nr:hypothetical protein [Bacillus dakarensis]
MDKKMLVCIFSVLLLVSGCSNDKETEKANKTVEENQQSEKELNVNEKSIQLEKKIKEEDGVIDGQVYEEEDKAIGKIVLDKKVSNEDAKNLVEKFSKELKKEYKDKVVSVQATKDGKVVEEMTINSSVNEKKEASNESKKTANDLNAKVLDVLPGVFSVKIPLEKANEVGATETSTLNLQVEGKEAIALTYYEEYKLFLNVNIPDKSYTKEELLNAVVSAK